MAELPKPQRSSPRIDPKAFYGITGEICKYLESRTEADPVAILIQLLTMFGNSIGRSAYICIEADIHYPKLFSVVVGRSAKARKGVSLGHAKRFFQIADPEWIRSCVKSGLSSGEGLIHHLRDEDTVESADPFPSPLRIDKRLLIEETEFASILRQTQRQGNTLSVFIRKAWDNDILQTLTKASTERASETHISIIGHITSDELTKLLNSTETANGFANRMLWIYAIRTQLLPLGAEIDVDTINFQANFIRESIIFAKTVGEVNMDKEAKELWASIYGELSRERLGILGHLLSRGEPYVLRIALIYALLDRSIVIKTSHLVAAKELWLYSEKTCEFIFDGKVGDANADRILQFLKTNSQKASRSQIIHEVFHNNKSKDEIDRALNSLIESGLVTCGQVGTEGRPKEIWALVR